MKLNLSAIILLNLVAHLLLVPSYASASEAKTSIWKDKIRIEALVEVDALANSVVAAEFMANMLYFSKSANLSVELGRSCERYFSKECAHSNAILLIISTSNFNELLKLPRSEQANWALKLFSQGSLPNMVTGNSSYIGDGRTYAGWSFQEEDTIMNAIVVISDDSDLETLRYKTQMTVPFFFNIKAPQLEGAYDIRRWYFVDFPKQLFEIYNKPTPN